MSDVAAVNVSKCIAVLEDGSLVPITNLFDAWGDECAPEDAVSAVAGPTQEGSWISLDLAEFEGAPLQ
jgi:hypothetical protein